MDFNFVELLKILLKRIKLVIAVVVIGVLATVGYFKFLVTPVYSANATVLIASGALFKDEGSQINTEYITTAELSTSFALMKSFAGILTESVEYYDKALALAKDEGLNGEYSVDSIARSTRIKYDEESIILDISVSTNDKNDSVVLIESLAKCAPETITSKLGRTSAVVLNVDTGAHRTSMSLTMYVVIAFVCSLVVATVLAVVVEKLDKTVKDEEDFLKAHNVPLLGTVPDFETKSKRRIVD